MEKVISLKRGVITFIASDSCRAKLIADNVTVYFVPNKTTKAEIRKALRVIGIDWKVV